MIQYIVFPNPFLLSVAFLPTEKCETILVSLSFGMDLRKFSKGTGLFLILFISDINVVIPLLLLSAILILLQALHSLRVFSK